MIYLRKDIDEFDDQLHNLLDKKLIERTKSPHSSPAFMVRNHSEVKRGKARMVINYKQLNEHIIFDGYFIPRKDVLINQTRGAKIFSKFDSKAGFWQIKLRKKSKPLTAFSTPSGHYQWTVMPFGLNTASQIYQRWMDKIFNDLKDFVVIYIDDILVFSKTRDEHRKHLQCLSEKLKNHGIILSPTKIDVEQESIDFLGLVLTHKDLEIPRNWLFEDINSEPKLRESVVYINFGSIIVVTPNQMVEFAWGPANSIQKFLAIIRPDLVTGDPLVLPPEFLTETKNRGMLACWCDQGQVLKHPSIGGLLTHCGWNSTIESGVGIEIDSDVKREKVERVVRELMEGENGKEMKNGVMELKKRAEEATGSSRGSSFLNLDNLVEEVLLLLPTDKVSQA
ncbi:(R)-mandelonitrile beta-glucosyltransferase-like [Cornus florida]|uniref:(R)-mandelonitrile beta-glucosyltransferase-like n=1 Tax=Cornus florida TaxID=4283 RepID=UPI00289F4891|nr:(R)-mandelonitrile beta-glucosyltransferase-like [Cornus florida]